MYFSYLFRFPLHDLYFLDNGSISSDYHHNECGDTSNHNDNEINSESASDNSMYILANTWKEAMLHQFLIASQEQAL